MSQIIHGSQQWVWFKRPPTVVKEFNHEHQAADEQITNVLSYLEHEGDVREHVFDPTDNTQNLILSFRVVHALPHLVKALEDLGWVQTEIPFQDQEERKEFYDALFKGGALT